MARATDEQKAYILLLARRSSKHVSDLPIDQLIIKIESMEKIAWEALTHEQATTLILLYQSKRQYRRRTTGITGV